MESVPLFWIDGMKPDHHLSGTEINERYSLKGYYPLG
jgi:hypothetical protein